MERLVEAEVMFGSLVLVSFPLDDAHLLKVQTQGANEAVLANQHEGNFGFSALQRRKASLFIREVAAKNELVTRYSGLKSRHHSALLPASSNVIRIQFK